MSFDKQAYMADYMRKRRQNARGGKLSHKQALTAILALLLEPKGDVGKQIHKIATEALSDDIPPA